MGFFDWVSGWFATHKHELSHEQQREVLKMIDRMRMEMQDNMNSATSSTSRRLETIITAHNRKLNANIEDSRHYFTNEMKRMSEELETMKKQLDGEEKKKKKEKEDADADGKLSSEYRMMLDMMKLMLQQQKDMFEQQKANNSYAGPPGGFPSQPGYSQWQQPPFPLNICNPNPANQQGHQGMPSSFVTPANSSGLYPNLSTNSIPNSPGLTFSVPNLPGDSNSVKDSPKKLVLPDKRDYEKYGLEHEGKDLSNVPKKLTSEPLANVDSQLGCGLILPDSRDYNKLITASVQKKRGDEEFEKLVDDFSQEFRPGFKSTNSNSGGRREESSEKMIADKVKNFFLNDTNQLNDPPKQRRSQTSSSNASVKEWLKSNENYVSDDDSNESDVSAVSARTDMSKFSSVSVTSGKRVFWNKSGNYGKPAAAAGSSSKKVNKYKSFEPKTNKGNANREYNPNQNRWRNMKKEHKDTDSAQNDKKVNVVGKEKNSKSLTDSASVTSASSSGRLAEIHYPSRAEAARRSLDLFEPLPRPLLFLGTNTDGLDNYTTHSPKCLNDIYGLEKRYKTFYTIEIARPT